MGVAGAVGIGGKGASGGGLVEEDDGKECGAVSGIDFWRRSLRARP